MFLVGMIYVIIFIYSIYLVGCEGMSISQPLESSIGGSGELFCGRNSCLARGMQSLEDE